MRRILAVLLIVALAVSPLVWIFHIALDTPVYRHTYYAALEKQYDRLVRMEENKVILVGGSNIAFGADSCLFQRLYGKPLVSLGLYGLFGTRLMMEISKANLRRGDIVIICPELSEGAFANNMNGEAIWKAVENRPDLLFAMNPEAVGSAVQSLIPFAIDKYEYLSSGTQPQNEGVYQYDSVSTYGEILPGLRPANIMRTGCLSEPILCRMNEMDDSFLDEINRFTAFCTLRGVRVLFSFPPVNAKAINRQGITSDHLYALYDDLSSRLNCDIISDPNRYIYDEGYFYDTNFHLNDSGVVLRTVQLVRDLNLYAGNNPELAVELPPAPLPAVKTVDIDEHLPYTDSSLFTYEETDGFLVITGVAGEAATGTELVLPVMHDGKYVTGVAAGALRECVRLARVTVPVGITELMPGCFEGCENLTEIRMLESSGKNVSVYDGTFDGVHPACQIVLVHGDKAEFALDYFWGRVRIPLVEETR